MNQIELNEIIEILEKIGFKFHSHTSEMVRTGHYEVALWNSILLSDFTGEILALEFYSGEILDVNREPTDKPTRFKQISVSEHCARLKIQAFANNGFVLAQIDTSFFLKKDSIYRLKYQHKKFDCEITHRFQSANGINYQPK